MHVYREPQTGDSATQVLTETFTLAVLLSGGVDRAEAAMLEAIQQVDPERCCDRELRQLSLRAASRAGREDATEEGAPGFPVELTRVLRLPAGLRECFVLRVLAGLSSEECADLNVFQADEGAWAAARELGKMRSSESCGGSIPRGTARQAATDVEDRFGVAQASGPVLLFGYLAIHEENHTGREARATRNEQKQECR
jgi:hypothetical protein